MRNITLLLITIGLCLGSASAQTYFGKKTTSTIEKSVVPDTLKILAVMADFQEDKDGATFGNGKFGSIYTKNYGESIIDPLPHDQIYFANHLEFAKNYYSKVSGGKVVVAYKIIPGIITVSKTMRNYSPPANNSSDLSSLAFFSKEVWQRADTLNPDINFSDYDLFTIFHAGVGRDISLPGSLGNERDLPSVYLSDPALRKVLSDNLTGMPLNRSGKTNSMIIPETESRELDVIGGVTLVEISINGLIAANIASHFGLPDLFDTKTGLSAIGRFGLMDGQSIFAYSGTFPPEPSPWEKIYLGWLTPVEVKSGSNIYLTAKEAASLSDTVVVKIPINSTEYYLIENRNRDAKKDGAVVTYITGGQTVTKTFTDTTGFQSYNVDSLSGVVINVDDYDWAVPGNGILIWHIDENIIQQNLATNTINANKFKRGVDVEEADGVQDIGEKFFTLFGDEVIGEGSDEDFWYKGNKAKLYKNRFDGSTLPAAVTNSGANSLIALNDFSAAGTRMSFRAAFGDSLITPFTARDLSELGTVPFTVTVSDSNRIYLTGNSALYYRSKSDNSISKINDFTRFKPAVYSTTEGDIVIGVLGSNINVIRDNGISVERKSLNTGYTITAPPAVSKETGNLIVGLSNGFVNYYSIADLFTNPQLITTEKTGSYVPVKQLAVSGNYVAALKYFSEGDSSIIIPKEYQIGTNSDKVIYFKHDAEPPLSFSAIKTTSGYDFVILERNNIFNVVRNNEANSFEIKSQNQISSFATGDLKQSGETSIIFTDGSNLRAVNLLGAGIVDFPFADTSRTGFSGTPLLLDYNGDKVSEILTYTSDGRIFLISADGQKVNGFPISTGTGISSVPAVNLRDGAVSITAFSGNTLYSWNLASNNPVLYWSEEFGNNKNELFSAVSNSTSNITEFFPKERAYNWPNPVYEDYTNIRYYVSEDAHMKIKIFDLAGDFVAELNHEAKGGFDNEVKWDVTNIQSGVYLAHVEATGVSGKNENTIIKIAVIK